jgi:cilia- and flagella-associated protein 57
VQSGKLLLAATATGCVRAYKYPLNGEFTELRVHSGPVACMRAFHDETVLFTCGEDGSVFVFDVKQDAAAYKRDADRLPFADEVMVTKSDLEDRKARCVGQ